MELNFDEERERLQTVRTELLSRVNVIESAIKALEGSINGALPTKGAKKGDGLAASDATPTGRRPMSAKARKAARARMLAYWAERRKATKAK